jgi:hypothetical protein
MKKIKTGLLTCGFAFICSIGLAQSPELLSSQPSTKEEFIASEKQVLASIDWLENTPINEEKDKRKEQNALLVMWITNSPTVTLTINAAVLDFTKKNKELLIIFMAGWTRYALQNNYSKEELPGALAGLKSAIKVYKMGQLKKDKEMEKLVGLDEKGELEEWVKGKLSKR